MKKTILLATTLMLSSTAFASVETQIGETSLHTDTFASKQAAYDAGLMKAQELRAMTPTELTHELSVFSQRPVYDSLKISDIEVKVEEFAKESGKVAYRAIVDVDYQYQYRESSNS
ncbi:DUF3316 domain-containing protein [Vibrio vulnificus]|uniref:DUF3316 domain-containing protein n=1 Tax=Vibrio TaxID=662 RepID=UPI00030DECEC|nr:MULTISPECIES: DUF3316 domain-containing protein [Vibrio]EGQ7756488.1 DUF3316 domain-containing protein [Vibrio vulnificus]EGQ7760165.1 DUF3316 domain-containing protein [Vibrio vulnificus]EGQ7937101.1 DUF3316 domain-containing protein [Vibrio vulnificus]EGQ8076822.1 DUF3316 domain-containing protein [Vibrio vulnificus]EGQ9972009.1 DUF3316 domain-containing protein [Vibrio vulnificus]